MQTERLPHVFEAGISLSNIHGALVTMPQKIKTMELLDEISVNAQVEVVLSKEITPFLAAARALGCEYQVGTDMLFEQIPAYLEFFNLPTTTAENLREIARL